MRSIRVITVASIAVCVALAFADKSRAETKAGDFEVSGAFSYQRLSIDDSDAKDTNTLTLQGGFGYFLGPEHQLQATVLGTSSFNDTTETFIFGLARYNYHFNHTGVLIPYIGPQAGVVIFRSSGAGQDTTAAGWAAGAQAGVKYFLTPRVTVFSEFNYLRTEVATFDLKENVFQVLFGLSFFFNRG